MLLLLTSSRCLLGEDKTLCADDSRVVPPESEQHFPGVGIECFSITNVEFTETWTPLHPTPVIQDSKQKSVFRV